MLVASQQVAGLKMPLDEINPTYENAGCSRGLWDEESKDRTEDWVEHGADCNARQRGRLVRRWGEVWDWVA